MNLKELEELKSEDVLYIKQARFDKLKREIFECSENLLALSDKYEKNDDLYTLEDLKKEFNSYLQTFGTLFSYIKVYKGPNHTYLETAVKQLKAQTILLLQEESKKNITAAEKFYVNHPNYTEKIKNINNINRFFIEVEIKYERFNSTLQCIIQSISVAKGDLNNTKTD